MKALAQVLKKERKVSELAPAPAAKPKPRKKATAHPQPQTRGPAQYVLLCFLSQMHIM